MTFEAHRLDGFEPNRLRNAVLAPPDEADVEIED